MRILMMILTLLVLATPVMAQPVDGDAMAARMNRDYDYPWDPSDQQYLKMPPQRQIQRYNQELAKYEVYQKARAQVQWQAMTPDQKRRFIQRHPEAFQPGGIYGDF